MIAVYTAVIYWVFRGKLRAGYRWTADSTIDPVKPPLLRGENRSEEPKLVSFRDPAIPDQTHSFKLEIPRKPSSLHDTPPVP